MTRTLVAAALGCGAFVAAAGLCVHRNAATAAEPLPEFRRIYAPADRAQDWPFRPERYLPIPAQQFEDAVRQVQQAAAPPAETAVVESRLTARFDGRDRLVGQAELTLRPVEGRARLVPLSAGSVPLDEAVWRETNAPAVLGNTPAGATAVWVERPGTLVCRWTCVGVRDSLGGIVFDLQTPAATAASLTLTLPAGHLPSDAGAVRASPPADPQADVVYEIRPLAPRRRLRIVTARGATTAAPRFALRQDADYEYSERGVDLTAQLRIDATDEPLARLDVEYDPGLTIVDARLSDRRLTWTAAEPPTVPRRATIEFDPPLFGAGRTVQLRALAPAQIGKRYALPTLRFPNLDWQQGTMSLAVAAPLTIDRLDTTSCVATPPTPLVGDRPGEVVDFTCFDAKASVRVLAARARDTLEATSVTSVAFAEDETKAEHQVEIRVASGERFLLQAAVPTRWIVDSVTSPGTGALADWTLSEVRDKHRWLTIRLAQALKPDRPLRLTIAARSKRPATGTAVLPDDLRIIDFRDARIDAPLAAVRAAASWRLELEREREETAPTVERLDPLRRELLGEFSPEFLLDLREAADPWRLTLARRAARLEAQLEQTVFAAGNELTERYRFEVTNQDPAPIDRLEVRFVPGRAGGVSWSLGEERSGGLQARRLPATTVTGTNKTAGTNDAETWELTFPAPMAGPVTLHAVRRSSWEQAAEIALAAVTDAVLGGGTVEIESNAATPLVVERGPLAPLPIVTIPDDPQRRIRGRFRYDPQQDAAAAQPRRLQVQRLPAGAGLPPAVVWEARQKTVYEADGRIVERAQLRVQSFGGKSFRWTFPAEAERPSIRVNDEPLPTSGPTVAIPLPADGEFCTVTAEYQQRKAARGPLQKATTPPLDVDVPLLHVERGLELPPHYAPLEVPSTAATDDVAARLRRLVNPATIPTARRPASAAPPTSADVSPWHDDEAAPAGGAIVASSDLWLVRTETTLALRFAAAALACALARCYLLRRRHWFWAIAGIAAAAATMLPAYPAALAAWSVYGLAAATAWEITLPQPRARKSSPGHDRIGTVSAAPPSTTTRQAIVTVWPLVVALSLAAAATAQAPPAATAEAAAVFIPVGPDGHPTGERYQVPERLWRSLSANIAAHDPTSAGGVVLTDADYTVVAAHDARRAKYLISEIRAQWNVHVVIAPTEAALPFTPFDASLTAVLVDGRPVETIRTSDGRRLRLAFDQTGPHRVEVIVRTATLDPPLGSGTALNIPRVNTGRLRATLPPELTGFAVAEAVGAPLTSADRRSFSTPLAPSDVLTLTWNDAASQADAVEFEQYEWWRVRPGAVTVDVKLRVVSPTAGGREIVLVVDPRLQWLPRRTGNGASQEATSTPLAVEQATVGQRLRLTLPETLRPDSVVEAGFLLNGATGIGKQRLPELRLERRPAVRRLAAVSIDPSCDFTFGGSLGFAPLAVPEFEKAWGAAAALPQAAFELRGPRDDWSLAVRPKPTRLSAVELQTLTCGRRRVEVAYEADIAPTGDAVTRHELTVPPEIDIASVAVVDAADGEEHLLRFTRDDAGAVIVLLRSPLTAAHKLSLRGRWNVPTAADSGFPFVQLRGTTAGGRRLRIVRLPEASVELLVPKNLAAETPEPTDAGAGLHGRLVGVWRVSAPNPTAKLKIAANVPKTAIRAVSTLRRDLQSWEYEFVAQLDVTAGTLDEIRLDFPTAVALPLSVIPSMPYEVAASREAGRRQLVLHPREAVKGKFQFALRGDLTALDREHPMPYVRLRGADPAEYFFQLPVRSGLNRVAWELEQLAPAALPPGFAKPAAEEMVTYRALGSEPSAVLREVRRGTGRPTVRLVDHRVRTTVAGHDGVSTWLVEPSGATEFTLHLPAAAELLAVRCGGADVAPLHTDKGYRIPAASEQMPHLIEVVYRSEPPGDSLAGTIAAPELVGLPIERTLWTVADDDPYAPWWTNDAATATALQTQRNQVLTAVVTELKADPGLGDAAAWIEPLERRRLHTADSATSSAATKSPLDFDAVWEASAAATTRRFYSTTTGESSYVARQRPALPGRGWAILVDRLRLWPAPAACLLAAALLWLAGRYDGLWRWSALAGVLVGLAWSAWLQPAWIGWIILAAVFASGRHRSLRQARERRTAPLGAMRLAR